MPKKNNTLICNNIFENKYIQERKQLFTQKMAELINQREISTGIYKQNGHMYNENQANRLVPIESPKERGDKT